MSRFETFAALHLPGDPVVLYNVWDVGSALAVVAAGAWLWGRKEEKGRSRGLASRTLVS